MVAVLFRNETTRMSFPLFLPSPRGRWPPKRGEDTSRPRLRPHAKFGVNRPAGCWEIVDRTKKTYSRINTRQFAPRMAGKKKCPETIILAGDRRLSSVIFYIISVCFATIQFVYVCFLLCTRFVLFDAIRDIDVSIYMSCIHLYPL